MTEITSNNHHEDSEDFFYVGISCYVAEADAGHATNGVVERWYVDGGYILGSNLVFVIASLNLEVVTEIDTELLQPAVVETRLEVSNDIPPTREPMSCEQETTHEDYQLGSPVLQVVVFLPRHPPNPHRKSDYLQGTERVRHLKRAQL